MKARPHRPSRLEVLAEYVQNADGPVAPVEIHEQTDLPIRWVEATLNRMAHRNIVIVAGDSYKWNPLVADIASFYSQRRAFLPGQNKYLLTYGDRRDY